MNKSIVGKRVKVVFFVAEACLVGKQGTITAVDSPVADRYPIRVSVDGDDYHVEGLPAGSLFALEEVRYLNNRPVRLG